VYLPLPGSNPFKPRDTKDIPDDPKLRKGGSILLGTTQGDRFILKINGEKIYEGFFEQALTSSFFPIGAVITDTEHGIRIEFNNIEDDKRSDERIYKLLRGKKLLN